MYCKWKICLQIGLDIAVCSGSLQSHLSSTAMTVWSCTNGVFSNQTVLCKSSEMDTNQMHVRGIFSALLFTRMAHSSSLLVFHDSQTLLDLSSMAAWPQMIPGSIIFQLCR
ncbi:hypothetical protein Ancab_000056 [Ancistrocladus abbreviatus]